MPTLSRSMFRVGRVASDLLRRLSLFPTLARRDATPTVMTSKSAHADRLSHQDCLSRLVYRSWIPCRLISIAHATTRCLDTQNVTTEDKELIDCKPTMDRIYFAPVIEDSSHRDGAIYKNKFIREDFWEGDIADRNETQLEPMMFSKATEKCLPVAENCWQHFQKDMFQFFSVQLSKTLISTGPIHLYGYIAARDLRDGMLNYVVNYSRDDPVIVQQGSLIEMTGPKRGIEMSSIVLIEFDMRIKNGMHEEEDLQLIDGAISCYDRNSGWPPIKNRICGNYGAVDISLGIVEQAVEATIEVVISEVMSGFSLWLSSFVDVINEYEEIQLFHGTIVHTGALRRFVVAVSWQTMMLLKFKVGSEGCIDSRQIKLQAKKHGCASQQIELKVAAISVKVTWSTI